MCSNIFYVRDSQCNTAFSRLIQTSPISAGEPCTFIECGCAQLQDSKMIFGFMLLHILPYQPMATTTCAYSHTHTRRHIYHNILFHLKFKTLCFRGYDSTILETKHHFEITFKSILVVFHYYAQSSTIFTINESRKTKFNIWNVHEVHAKPSQ